MANVDAEKIRSIGSILLNSEKPMKFRFRALFSLKSCAGPLSVSIMGEGFSDSSALLKHEIAYCLGQMQDKSALPLLCRILEDVNQEPIVRHEAAEALGAIGSQEAIPYLEKYVSDDIREISETCQLALDRMKWLDNKKSEESAEIKFNSVDPAPALCETDTVKLENILLNKSFSLFDRYRAMFALRNLNTNESALILAKALKDESALLSHEVAFVLGQLRNEVTVSALSDCLKDLTQNEMVRHECVEALGAIGTEECFQILSQFLNDDKRVVRESCEIALDMIDYELSNEFQYAIV